MSLASVASQADGQSQAEERRRGGGELVLPYNSCLHVSDTGRQSEAEAAVLLSLPGARDPRLNSGTCLRLRRARGRFRRDSPQGNHVSSAELQPSPRGRGFRPREVSRNGPLCACRAVLPLRVSETAFSGMQTPAARLGSRPKRWLVRDWRRVLARIESGGKRVIVGAQTLSRGVLEHARAPAVRNKEKSQTCAQKQQGRRTGSPEHAFGRRRHFVQFRERLSCTCVL